MNFLHKSWYCVGWSLNHGDGPVGIKLLNRELVLFRRSDGTIACIDGICPHRFAPLSRGKVCNDVIQCGYHGLEFDGEGRCVRNPHGSGTIAPNAHLNSYPVVEKSGAIWVWMGGKSAADPAEIPEFDFVHDRKNWAGATGYLKIDANYQLLIDNLLDLTHATYIHANTVGVGTDKWEGETRIDYDFSASGKVINSDYIWRNSPPTPLLREFSERSAGDIHVPMRLYLASSLILNIAMCDRGAPPETGDQMPSAHLLAPETENTTHYFYAIARDDKLDDAEITARMIKLVEQAFVDEDAPMIEDIAEIMDDREFFAMRPLILETDKAAIHARRTLAKLIRNELDNTASPTDGAAQKKVEESA